MGLITMQVIKSLHGAILVSNLEEAENFYGRILGLPKVDRPLNFPGTWYQVGDFQIHLIQSPEVIPDLVNLEKYGRNRHLAFSVTNIEVAKQRLLANNCQFQASASGRPALFVRDPDGNIIELSQIAE